MLKVYSLEFMVDDIPCELITINPCSEGKPENRPHFQHTHSGCEIHYVISGEVSMDCLQSRYRLSSGQMLIVPPGVYHYVRSVSEDVIQMNILIEINPKGNKSRNHQLADLLQTLLVQRPILLEGKSDSNHLIYEQMERIQKFCLTENVPDFLHNEWMKILSAELVLLMASLAEQNSIDEESKVFTSMSANTNRYIMDQFFNHNYSGNSKMEELAKELNVSVRQIGRIVHQTYGKGFREKMNECRLAVAVDLLRNTTKSMTEISEILGYSEPANFSCFIKRQTGKTPAKIRKTKGN